MVKENSTKKSHTWIFFLLYIALLLAAMMFFLRHVSKVLTVYEASQPTHAIEALTDSLSEKGIAGYITVMLPDITKEEPDAQQPYTLTITQDLPYTDYEEAEDYVAELNEMIRQNGVQYHREMEDYTTGAIRYSLYTGEHRFAETSLLPGDTLTRLKLLTITQWIPQEIRLLREAPKCCVMATIPAGDTLMINDLPVESNHILGSATLPGLDYCRNYVEIPDLLSYEITDLYRLPRVTILDAGKNTIAEYDPTANNAASDGLFHVENNRLSVDLQPSESEMPEDLQRYVLDCVETYSLFFSRDLPGATGSTAPIRHLFPADSEYLSLAEEYRRNSMGYFDSHSKTHFVTEQADQYITYGEDCFCCHVYLEKSMTIYGSREVIDKTEGIYYFVKINDTWVIADIQ